MAGEWLRPAGYGATAGPAATQNAEAPPAPRLTAHSWGLSRLPPPQSGRSMAHVARWLEGGRSGQHAIRIIFSGVSLNFCLEFPEFSSYNKFEVVHPLPVWRTCPSDSPPLS